MRCVKVRGARRAKNVHMIESHVHLVESHVHLAFAPQGAGLLYAVMWFAQRGDVYGWYVGLRDGVDECSYFMLPANDPQDGREVLYRSLDDDVHGRWVAVNAQGQTDLAHSPVPQALCPELSRLQSEFVSGWLFFNGDPGSAGEAQLLNDKGLPVRHANIRAARIGKLTTGPVLWHYDAPGIEPGVLVRLSSLWPLDERVRP